MFNLVGKRYLFLIISLIVIIPGTLSLIFRGLNLGIDFTQGTNIELRPRAALTIPQINTLLKPLNLQSLQVVPGSNTSLPGNQNIWVRLSTRIDTNVQDAITKALQGKYNTANSTLSVTFDDLLLDPLSGTGKATTVTVVTVTKFATGVTPKISDIESLLANLPDTSNPGKGGPTSTPTAATTTTPATTPTVSPTATTAVNSTATPTATTTPKATATATGTATPNSSPVVSVSPTATPTDTNPSNIPVKVAQVYQGATTQTVTFLTLSLINSNDLLKLKALFANSNSNYVYVLDNATVSASVASETTRNAFLAVLAASAFILLYISFAFRKVVRPWRYGACAIIALLHDVLVVLGIFSILGWTLHVQVDALFITALLTVVGFSVHDTIVVFDRIRENMTRRTSETFEQVVNASLVQTMARSLNTSLTVLFTLSALTLFGGTTIRVFSLALLIGILSGTYSSIFNASMLLVMWERGEFVFKFFNRSKVTRTPDGREVRELTRTRG
ncbi:MAG TPA: protein translocase subunit SecF [Ktedonobacteraceae bacterium]|nr:protein translocase subunit SecF [Ktedonobacteraceae bacterium]